MIILCKSILYRHRFKYRIVLKDFPIAFFIGYLYQVEKPIFSVRPFHMVNFCGYHKKENVTCHWSRRTLVNEIVKKLLWNSRCLPCIRRRRPHYERQSKLSCPDQNDTITDFFSQVTKIKSMFWPHSLEEQRILFKITQLPVTTVEALLADTLVSGQLCLRWPCLKIRFTASIQTLYF